jgi:hypothetical protein
MNSIKTPREDGLSSSSSASTSLLSSHVTYSTKNEFDSCNTLANNNSSPSTVTTTAAATDNVDSKSSGTECARIGVVQIKKEEDDNNDNDVAKSEEEEVGATIKPVVVTTAATKKVTSKSSKGNSNSNSNTSNNHVVATTTIRMKKEEEEEEDGSVKNNNDNPTGVNNYCSNNNNNKNKKKDNNNDDYYDYYADWKVGNWCWVLPPSTTTTNTNTNTNTNNIVIPPTTVNSSRSSSKKRTASTRSRNAKSIKNNEEDTSKSKKMKLLPPPTTPSNTSRNNTTTVKREKEEDNDSVCHNDDDDEVNNKVNNEDGFGSWTVGNWCSLLPTGNSSSNSSSSSPTVKIRTEQRNSLEISPPNSEGRKQQRPVRDEHFKSSQTALLDNDVTVDENNNELDTDYSDVDNDNDNDDQKQKLMRTGKNAMAYNYKHNKNWNVMFQRLVSYKKQHNSTTVPYRCVVNPKLGLWVSYQRTRYRNNSLSDHRVDLLNSIGFVWNKFDTHWDEMFQRLVTYTKQHDGSTLVPFKYEADTQLGNSGDGCMLNADFTITTNFLQSGSNVLNRLLLFGMCMKGNGLRCIIDLWRIRNDTSQHKYHPLTPKMIIFFLADGL